MDGMDATKTKKQGGFGETLLNGNFHGWVSTHIGGWFETEMFQQFGRVNAKSIGMKFNRVKPALDKAVSYHHSPDETGTLCSVF